MVSILNKDGVVLEVGGQAGWLNHLNASVSPPMKRTVEIAPTRKKLFASHTLNAVPAVSAMSNGSVSGR